MGPCSQLFIVGEFSFFVDIPHLPSDTTLIPRSSLIRSSTRFLFFTMQASEQVSNRMTFGGKVTNSLLCDKIVRTASSIFVGLTYFLLTYLDDFLADSSIFVISCRSFYRRAESLPLPPRSYLDQPHLGCC